MDKLRFAVTGSGWRAGFYLRAARLLPARFEVTGVLCRSRERAEAFSRETGVPAVHTLDALLAPKPDFVVSCVTKAAMTRQVIELLRAGVPTLSETPLASDEASLLELDRVRRETGVPLELAEQYALYPMHAARGALIARGLIGDPVSCRLSEAHDYHGVSLLRHYLGEEGGAVSVRAERTRTPLAVTGSRAGYQTDGGTAEETRTFAHLAYPGNRAGLYDFSGSQYHSAIRSRHVRVLGTRGEISDACALYLTPEGRPVRAALEPRRDVITGTIYAIDFAGERVYENPFGAAVPLDEDETAVCCVLAGMGERLAGGKSAYPLRYGFTDAYLACLMDRAAQTGERLVSRRMPWDADA